MHVMRFVEVLAAGAETIIRDSRSLSAVSDEIEAVVHPGEAHVLIVAVSPVPRNQSHKLTLPSSVWYGLKDRCLALLLSLS